MENRKPVIAIDGFSSTGKSSISKIIAKRLGLVHLDTGALYRGITLYALEHCTDTDGKICVEKLFNLLPELKLEFKNTENGLQLFLNNRNIENEIRKPRISENVSYIAKQPEVRAFLLDMQQKMADNGGIIMDGRDIGTVVLPNADYKFFLTASVDERTRRRYAELLASGQATDVSAVRENLLSRDKTDSERAISPLKQADDAILIDNTNLTKEETISLILSKLK